MATRSANTMAEVLQAMLADISLCKTLPDADLEFLTNLETVILKKLREPVEAMAQAQQQQQSSAGASAMGGGSQVVGDLATASGGGVGVPGVMSMPTPPVDEFRRAIGG